MMLVPELAVISLLQSNEIRALPLMENKHSLSMYCIAPHVLIRFDSNCGVRSTSILGWNSMYVQ